MGNLRRVLELVKGRFGSTRGTKLLAVSSGGLQQSCYRPMQKLIPFEIVKNKKVNSNKNHDEGNYNNEIPARRAAIKELRIK